MLRGGTRTLTAAAAALASAFLMGQAIDPGSPIMAPPADEPTPAVDTAPPATAGEGRESPPAANKAVVVPVEKPPAPKPATKTEVLPWANAPAVATPFAAPDPAAAAAEAQCAGLFEAQCRETKTCAWVAHIRQQDGTVVSARCVARRAAPPKKAAKAKPKPKPKPKVEASASEAPPQPPAVAPATPAQPAPAAPIIVTVPPE